MHLEESNVDERRRPDSSSKKHVAGVAVTGILVVAVGLLLGRAVVSWFDTDQHHDPIGRTATDELYFDEPVASTGASLDVDSSVGAGDEAAPAAVASTTPAESAPVPSSAAGREASVVAIVYPGSTKVAGAVPTEADVEAVVSFVMAASSAPGWIIRDLAVDPSVSPDVTIRLIDLTSPAFDLESSAIPAGHALQLDRIASLLQSTPALSLGVIGHLDLDGTADVPADLAEARARADVDYLVTAGISRDRLSTIRGDTIGVPGGEDGQLAAALAGRTEFLFAGATAP